MNTRLIDALCLLAVLLSPPLAAQQQGAQPPAAKARKARPRERPRPAVVTRRGFEIAVRGEKLLYDSTAGYLPVVDECGKLEANVFFVAYTVPTKATRPKRPITFTYSGGPGSSSMWLHLGAAGPWRVEMGDNGEAPAPPYRLVPNEGTWLPFTDLVFIDPVGTGYSRPAESEKGGQGPGMEEHLKWVGDFIRLYTTKYRRWGAPKFVAGESHGMTGAAGLSRYLQDSHDMYLNGLVLISSTLNFRTTRTNAGNDLPYPLSLPSFAATAWYHRLLPPKLQQDLQATLDEVEHWALREYTTALTLGDALPSPERQKVVEKLARYTGLSKAFVEKVDLRISASAFRKELLRHLHRTVGHLDSRFKGIERRMAGLPLEYDLSVTAISGAYAANLNEYVRECLRYENDIPYRIMERVRPRDHGQVRDPHENAAEALRRAMCKNRHLKVMVASGYYDLATPYFASEYTMNHLGLDRALRSNIIMTYYEAGHMMYIRKASLLKLRDDLAAFYAAALETASPPERP